MEKRLILAIDDDATVLEILKTGLESMGYSVATADDPEKARQTLASLRPDAILMDIGMPGMDGITFCRDLRRLPEMQYVPVIMVSAFDDDKTIHDALLFGAADFITKPFDIVQIRQKIEDAVARFRAKRGAGL